MNVCRACPVVPAKLSVNWAVSSPGHVSPRLALRWRGAARLCSPRLCEISMPVCLLNPLMRPWIGALYVPTAPVLPRTHIRTHCIRQLMRHIHSKLSLNRSRLVPRRALKLHPVSLRLSEWLHLYGKKGDADILTDHWCSRGTVEEVISQIGGQNCLHANVCFMLVTFIMLSWPVLEFYRSAIARTPKPKLLGTPL